MSSVKEKVFSGLFWKFSERMLAQMISLIVSIILARILAPEDYGAVALVMVFISIANVFVSSGLGNALVQKKNADNLDFSSVFFINVGLSIIVYGIIYVIAPVAADFYSLDILCPAMRVLGIAILFAGVNSVQHAYVSRHMMFKRFFWSTLFGTLLSGVVGVTMAYLGYGVWALVLQHLTNTCVDTVVLWVTVKWRPEPIYSWERAKSLISYGWKLLAASLLDTGYRQLRGLIIGKIYTKSDLAFYNQGDKYPNMIAINVNASIIGVLFPAFSQNQSDKNKLRSMVRRAIQVSSTMMWPMMIGFAACSETIVRLVLTEKWLPCVPYIYCFCFSYGLWPIHTANLQALNAMGRSDLFFKLEIIKKIIGIVAILLSVKYGPFAIALSMVIAGLLATFINAHPNKALLGYSIFDQLKDMFPAFLISIIMGVCIYPIKLLHCHDAVVLILQIVSGGLIYCLVSYASRQEPFFYVIELLTERLEKKHGR